jgi:hypothetical protein
MGYGLLLKLGIKALPYIAVIAIVGGSWWYVQNLRHNNEILEIQNKQLVTERDAWKESYGDLKLGLDEQIKILTTVSKQGDKLKAEFKNLTSSVHVRLGVINNNLADLKGKDLSGLTCEQAIDYLRNIATQKGST